MDKEIVENFIINSCRKHGAIYSNDKIILDNNKFAKVDINTHQNIIHFSSFFKSDDMFHFAINYVSKTNKYRCIHRVYHAKDREYTQLEDAMEYSIYLLLEEYKDLINKINNIK